MDTKTTQHINKDLILRERLALQRTAMSNDTTLLSFIRTALYFSVAGLSVNTLLKVSYGVWIEIVFFSASLFILMVGIWKYIRQKRSLRDSEKHIGDYKLHYESGE
jgi:putative membrane protein